MRHLKQHHCHPPRPLVLQVNVRLLPAATASAAAAEGAAREVTASIRTGGALFAVPELSVLPAFLDGAARKVLQQGTKVCAFGAPSALKESKGQSAEVRCFRFKADGHAVDEAFDRMRKRTTRCVCFCARTRRKLGKHGCVRVCMCELGEVALARAVRRRACAARTGCSGCGSSSR